MRVIKFKVLFRAKYVGIERLGKDGWEWMAFDLNPDKGERWTSGVFPKLNGYTRYAFTGLQDRLGVDIYEGDIVKVQKEYGEIVYLSNQEDVGFQIKWIKNGTGWNNYLHVRLDEMKVIGNIYENPELIK